MESSITRTTAAELKFYIDEILGDLVSEIITRKSEMPDEHPKFSRSIIEFIYKGIWKIVVISGPGNKASHSDNGSLSVTVYIYPIKDNKSNLKKETNAFYNVSTKDVNYDPVLRNGRDVAIFIKSVLEEDDRDNDFILPNLPKNPKLVKKPIMV